MLTGKSLVSENTYIKPHWDLSADFIIFGVVTKMMFLMKKANNSGNWTTAGISFQNKKETDFANLIKETYKANSRV